MKSGPASGRRESVESSNVSVTERANRNESSRPDCGSRSRERGTRQTHVCRSLAKNKKLPRSLKISGVRDSSDGYSSDTRCGAERDVSASGVASAPWFRSESQKHHPAHAGRSPGCLISNRVKHIPCSIRSLPQARLDINRLRLRLRHLEIKILQ